MKISLTASLVLFATILLSGQDSTRAAFGNWIKYREGFKIEPFLQWQLWTVYSTGEEIYKPESGTYQPIEDRLNIQFRRARFGFRAQPFTNFRFTLAGAYDVLGRDALSGTQGPTNNLSIPDIGIWDAFMEWRILPKREYLNLVAGYFRPQFSRESITGAWAVPSFEKSMSQNYLRKHLTGYGPGRAMGLNLGGTWRAKNTRTGLHYNLGVFTPQYLAFGGLSAGRTAAPLWAGRVVWELGDPESSTYKINYDLNFYGRRNGISLALSGAWQGKSDLFTSNYGLECDVLWNYGPFNFDAEHNWLWRDGVRNGAAIRSGYTTGHIRGSFNLIFKGKYFLEPTAMVMFFDGPSEALGQAEASYLKLSSGSEHTYDLGINWHLQEKKWKILLHYIWRYGDPGSADPGNQVNAFFSESGVGAIRRGNILGIGLHAIL
jgi:hypothetical protein